MSYDTLRYSNGTEQMDVHGILGQARRLRDFRYVKVLDESQQKNGSLLFRQGLRRLPHRFDLSGSNPRQSGRRSAKQELSLPG